MLILWIFVLLVILILAFSYSSKLLLVLFSLMDLSWSFNLYDLLLSNLDIPKSIFQEFMAHQLLNLLNIDTIIIKISGKASSIRMGSYMLIYSSISIITLDDIV